MAKPRSYSTIVCFVLVATAGCRQLLDIQDGELESPKAATNGLSNQSTGSSEPSPSEADSGAQAEALSPDADKPTSETNESPPSNTNESSDSGTVADKPDAAPSDPVIVKPAEMPDVCLSYCLAVGENCQDQYEQYQELSLCLDVCQLFAIGEEDDKKKNTVHCRLRQAKLANLEPFTHCKFAGPGGNGECGENCEGFCDIATLACTLETAGSANDSYADREECLTDCKGLPDLGDYTTASEVEMFSGDHVQCRLFHACAATTEADYHCAHATGDFPCRAE